MRVGILGSGDVAKSLGRGFHKQRHEAYCVRSRPLTRASRSHVQRGDGRRTRDLLAPPLRRASGLSFQFSRASCGARQGSDAACSQALAQSSRIRAARAFHPDVRKRFTERRSGALAGRSQLLSSASLTSPKPL
jgi:hypothetical protein